jgi:hypothetical protein
MNKTLHSIYVGSFFVVGILSTFLLIVNGYQYYATPLVDRFFNPQNSLLQPSGFIGEGLGVVGSIMMIVGVAVYMVRKRVKALIHFGYLKNWLELHIFLCTLGPVFVLFHTSFKFGGIVAVSFWSMTAVVLSGVVGRFLYVRIPKSIQGQILSVQELNDIGKGFSKRLQSEYHVSDDLIRLVESSSDYTRLKKETLWNSIVFLFRDTIHTRRTLRTFRNELKRAGLSGRDINNTCRIARARMVIARRIRVLSTMHRFFRHWHIVHLPFAIVMFVIMFIHIGVVFAFGYGWAM